MGSNRAKHPGGEQRRRLMGSNRAIHPVKPNPLLLMAMLSWRIMREYPRPPAGMMQMMVLRRLMLTWQRKRKMILTSSRQQRK